MQATLQILTKNRKKRATPTKTYLHVIKQTLTKIYKTFKSFESVKNVHLCHHVKSDDKTNVFSTGKTSYAGILL